jgi:hypothetical protein
MLMNVQTIVDSAIDLADMRNSRYIDQANTPNSEILRYANIAYKDLYAQIVLSKEHYFTISYPLVVTPATDTYQLPYDFYKLDGVDLLLDNNGNFLTLLPFMFNERNRYRNSAIIQTTPWGQAFRYMIVGNNIRFIPAPTQTSNLQLWYTPEPMILTSLLLTLNLPIGGDEYMSLYIACMMLAKEESDTSAINAKRLEVLFQLKNSLKERDSGNPSYVIDVNRINQSNFFPFVGYNY